MRSNTIKNLFEDSHQLTKPAQALQLISEEDILEIHLLIKEVIQDFLAKDNLHIGLKTYINQELRNDITDRMVKYPPSTEESLENWSQQIFGNEKFGMILNSLETYNNQFSEKVATIISPLLQLAGLPLGGLSFLFFMGNYGFTPFGVHKESTGEEGFLFHLGPGNKQFYTWDDSKYNSIEHNKTVFHNFHEMLPFAKSYELSPGDAMFIPHQVYHIANTSEFSLSFVIDYINPPTDRFENQLMQMAGQEEIWSQNTYQQPIKIDPSQTNSLSVLNYDSLQKKIALTLHRKTLLLKSNAGILKKSKKTSHSVDLNGQFTIKSKPIFPIYLEELPNNKILIFARGHRIVKKQHSKLRGLIHLLNKGELLTFETLTTALIPKWDLIEIYSLMNDLSQVDAITITSTN